jgi:hypothetical protein
MTSRRRKNVIEVNRTKRGRDKRGQNNGKSKNKEINKIIIKSLKIELK